MAGTNLGTAWIQIKPTMKGVTSSLKKEFAGASDAVSGEGSKLSSAFSQMGSQAGESLKRGLMIGATAAVTGAIALIKSAVSQFADYEQLVGGVDTLFKNSSEQVQKYAANAYKTAQISANKYMETVTSFSASLLQSLGGDTAKAAKYADQAIIDMADNSNKMGTAMEMIQNAYQGFAKQNYTMLDNLKLGYGGTRGEMQRLLDDAGKLSGMKFDISSFADITQAIHIIQEQMGITGTSAEEASETITGSVNAAKGAWSNFMVSLGDSTQDSGEKFKEFTDSVSIAIENIVPKIANTLTTVWNMLGQISPFLQPILIFLSTVVGIFAAQKVFMGLMGIFNLIAANPVVFAIGAIVTAIYLLITHWDELSAAVGGVIENISNAIGGFAEWVGGVFQGIWDTVTGIFSKIGEFFKGVWDKITKIFTGIGTFIGEAVSGGFKAVVNGILGFVENFINTPINILNGFLDIINGAFGWLGVNLTHIEGVNLPRLASGGLVRGVGTDTSDSNLYALSKGEYVIRAAAARDIGYDNLRRMNETGEISNSQMVNITINGYNKSPEELATIISRKIAFNQRGVIG